MKNVWGPRKKQVLLLIALALVIAFFVFRQESLPGGVQRYYVHGASRDYHDLVRKHDGMVTVVVPADVQWAKGRLSLIYGYIKPYLYSDGYSSKEGYFVLHTKTWELWDGLSKKEMNDILKSGYPSPAKSP